MAPSNDKKLINQHLVYHYPTSREITQPFQCTKLELDNKQKRLLLCNWRMLLKNLKGGFDQFETIRQIKPIIHW
jgi:hypothetical protein